LGTGIILGLAGFETTLALTATMVLEAGARFFTLAFAGLALGAFLAAAVGVRTTALRGAAFLAGADFFCAVFTSCLLAV
jgi:hypothetical protein